MYKDIDKAVKRIQELEQCLEQVAKETNWVKIWLENPWDIPINDKNRKSSIKLLEDIDSNIGKTIWRKYEVEVV